MFCGFLVTSTSCLHGGLASSLPAALPWTPPLPFLAPPSGHVNQDPVVLDLYIHALHMLQQFIDEVDVEVGIVTVYCLIGNLSDILLEYVGRNDLFLLKESGGISVLPLGLLQFQSSGFIKL
ncbi:hypothetical protein STEG23_026207 [Scotinomys teguina]